jgi:hypothetical protein
MPFGGPEITLDSKAESYAKQLRNLTSLSGPWDYLMKHGLASAPGNADIIDRYGIGCVRDPVVSEDRRFVGSLSIPYMSRAGVKSIVYRCVMPHDHAMNGHQKYQQPSGQRTRIFNSNAYFMAGNTIGLAEGEVDAIAASELVGIPTLGISGTQKWNQMKNVWMLTLRDFDHIIYFADGDAPGTECGREVCSDLGKRAVLVRCDNESDVSTMCASGGAAELQRRAGLTE